MYIQRDASPKGLDKYLHASSPMADELRIIAEKCGYSVLPRMFRR
jgi:hypothetical protein